MAIISFIDSSRPVSYLQKKIHRTFRIPR